MIGQFLSNTNESATVSILQKNLELNMALVKEKKNWSVKGIFFSRRVYIEFIMIKSRTHNPSPGLCQNFIYISIKIPYLLLKFLFIACSVTSI